MSDWIAILSDIHLGEERPPMIRHPGATELLLSEAVEKIWQLGVGKTILLGDTVNQGWRSEYTRAREILAPLADGLEPMVGNHELQRSGIADFVSVWGVQPVREISVWGMPTLLLNSGIERLPDKKWNGRLDDAQLGRLDEFLAAHADEIVTIFCHHPITNTVRGWDRPMNALDNSDALRQRLERHGHQIIFVTGHTHCQSIVRQQNVIYIGCPSLCFWPHAFLIGERLGDEIRISTVRVRDDQYSPDTRACGADQLVYRADNEGTSDDWRCIIKLQ